MSSGSRLGLDVGEALLADVAVSFAGRFDRELALGPPRPAPTDTASLLRMTRPFGSPRRISSVGRYRAWQDHAESVGFPLAGMVMRLAVTDRRLLVYRVTFVRARAKALAGWLPLAQVVQASLLRGVIASKLLLVLDSGALLTFETSSPRRARRFAAALSTARGDRSR